MPAYSSQFTPVSALTSAQRSAMADLYLAHYDGSSAVRFEADLSGKHEVLLIHADGVLIGFTTLELYTRVFDEREVRIVYSGDTVVDRAHWGQQTLAFAWIRRMGELQRGAPSPLYWFLIVKGHRTFRYLPAFARTFIPHWQQEDDALKPLLDCLAREKFGADYNPATGVVAFKASRGHLRAGIAEPDADELAKPAVAFFMARNPGFRQGHELCCLCELSEANMRPLSLRLFRGSAA